MSVAGLVLAAGRSTRLEAVDSPRDSASGATSKLLLPYGSMTVVEAVVRAALAGGLSPVFVVVGHRAKDVRRALEDLDPRLRLVDNPAFATGQSSSLSAGVLVAGEWPEVEAVGVLLADEPGMLASSVRAVVAGWREAGADIARARYSDRPGHPVVFGRSMFEALRGLRGDEGAISLLRDFRHAVCNVPIGSPAPVDVDTEQDYREALQRLERGARE